MTGLDEAPERHDHSDHSDATDTRIDDYPQGSVASPTRTRL